MSAVVVSLILLGLFCAVFRLLHLSIYAGEPKLFYKEGSHFITLPMFLLNATDDPLVPPSLVEIGIEYAKTHPNSILVETRHGGHLGFFESGILTPDPITWLDRSALQYAEAIVTLFVANSLPHLNTTAASCLHSKSTCRYKTYLSDW
uniref:Abhydrolase domain-containing protein 2 n=1 Tax=Magallana gigas TaxID=29159 RepID=K1R6T7_MAGGI